MADGGRTVVALPDDDPRMRVQRALLKTDGQCVTVHAEAQVRMHVARIVPMTEKDCLFPAPVLMLEGEVEGFLGDFPNGIKAISYPRPVISDNGRNKRLVSCALPTVKYMHRFTPREQIALCDLGLMQPGFSVPEIISNNVYQLPIDVDVRLVQTDVGLIPSVQIHNEGVIETSTDDDGYQFVTYFQRVLAPEDADKVQTAIEQPTEEAEIGELTSEAHDFSHLQEQGLVQEASPDQTPAADQSQVDAADEEVAAQLFGDEGTAYEEQDRDIVNEVFRKIMAGAPDTPSGDARAILHATDGEADTQVAPPTSSDVTDDDLALADILGIGDAADRAKAERKEAARRKAVADDGVITADEQAEIDATQ